MTPAAIIRQAAEDGVKLTLTPAGTIKAVGNGKTVGRWLAVIREHKAQIVDVLRFADCNGGAAPDRMPEWDATRDAFEERAAIVDFDGGLSCEEAERVAWALILNRHRLH